MANVVHELVVNLETGAYTVKPPLDIHQGDSNTHVLLFKLRNNECNFLSINPDARPTISFIKEDIGTGTRKEIISDAVTIVNPYRGVLSYVVGPALVKDYGRYTVVLNIGTCFNLLMYGPKVTFTITITKVDSYQPEDLEVAITQEFYDEVVKHLNNQNIHVSETDRLFLNTFENLSDKLFELVTTDWDKKIEEIISGDAGIMLRRAFVTLDLKSEMTELPDDELCHGKLIRINYPNHDGDKSTLDLGEDPDPVYYVALYHGTPDDDGFYEFHEVNLGGVDPDVIAAIREAISQLQNDVITIKNRLDTDESNIRQLQNDLNIFDQALRDLLGRVVDLSEQVDKNTDDIITINQSITWNVI